MLAELARKAQRAPFLRGRQVHYALWLKRAPGNGLNGAAIVTPNTVMAAPAGQR